MHFFQINISFLANFGWLLYRFRNFSVSKRFQFLGWYPIRYRKNLVSKKISDSLSEKKLVSKKVSDSVLEKFGIEKSIGFGIGKSIGFGIGKNLVSESVLEIIWYRKKYWIQYRKYFVLKKVSDLV